MLPSASASDPNTGLARKEEERFPGAAPPSLSFLPPASVLELRCAFSGAVSSDGFVVERRRSIYHFFVFHQPLSN